MNLGGFGKVRKRERRKIENGFALFLSFLNFALAEVTRETVVITKNVDSVLGARANWLKIYFLANRRAANRLNGTGYDRRPGRHQGPETGHSRHRLPR